MARNDTITNAAGQWRELTNSSAAFVRFINLSPGAVWIMATSDGTPPTSLAGAIPFEAGMGIAADIALSDLFPGVTSPARLWGYSENVPLNVSVSHA